MIKALFLALGLFCFEVLPAQTSSHKEAVDYYVKITNNAKTAFFTMSRFTKCLTDYLGYLNPKQKQLLDKNRLDTLQTEYELWLATLTRSKDSLKAMREIDTVLEYKQHMINSYDGIATAMKTLMPKLIAIFKKGVSSTTELDVMDFKDLFAQTMAAAFEQLQQLEEIDNRFKEKYAITKEELVEKGL